jgi:hypothetical protein
MRPFTQPCTVPPLCSASFNSSVPFPGADAVHRAQLVHGKPGINTLSRTDIVQWVSGLLVLWGSLAYEAFTPKVNVDSFFRQFLSA